MSSDLKPCPFCGGEALEFPYPYYDKNSEDFRAVACFNPNCRVRPQTFYSKRDKAINDWNRRASNAES